MTINAFILAGTGFPDGGDGICETFLAHLDERFFPQIVRYPATFGGTRGAWARSRAAGRKALIDAIRSTNNLALIGGYSQGAGIAGDLAAEIGRGALPDLEVVGCALIADPNRPPGGRLPGELPASGYGIAGSRRIDNVPTWWAAAEGDPITALPVGSPLRSIADIAEFYSLASPADAAAWGQALIERARAGRWQRWWSIENWQSWGGAARYAYNYTPLGGRHTRAYVDEGLCVRLAEAVNREVAR